MTPYQWTAVLVYSLVAAHVAATSDENEVSVVRGNNEFGMEWYKLQNKKNENIVISPASALIALAMTSMGAEGTTFSQMARGMHLPEDKGVIAKGAQLLIKSVLKAGEANDTLDLADRIYIDSTFELVDNFTATVKEYFLSDIVSTDFMGNPDQSRTSINQWVEEKTHNRIQDLLSADIVTSDTRSVLVNVIYFKDSWQKEFDSKKTREQSFYKSCNEVEEVNMMETTDYYPLAELPDCKALQLDYKGNELYMLIILPRLCEDGSTLDQVSQNINLTDVQNSLVNTKVHVSLPKFRIEKTIGMNGVLKKMGMELMFTNSADFSGISSNEGMKVSHVIQKTFVEVNEEGTEAAAATAVVGTRITSIGGETYIPQFTANQPFLWFIMEKKSQAILFLGSFKGNKK